MRGRLLGSEMGSDARRFSAALHWRPRAALGVGLEGRSTIASNATYAGTYDSAGRWHVAKRGSAPDELSELALGTISVEPTPATRATLRLGADRTRNVMFAGGRRRSYVVDVAVRWRP